MMRLMVTGLIVCLGLLPACHGQQAIDSPHEHSGRFAGIGVFEAGRVWRHLAVDRPRDPAVAGVADDEAIIAVIDSRTGEIRQCGNHSGTCISMNPWAGGQPATLPARLRKHAAELDADEKASTSEAGSPQLPASSRH